jgi:hypothetical protein
MILNLVGILDEEEKKQRAYDYFSNQVERLESMRRKEDLNLGTTLLNRIQLSKHRQLLEDDHRIELSHKIVKWMDGRLEYFTSPEYIDKLQYWSELADQDRRLAAMR